MPRPDILRRYQLSGHALAEKLASRLTQIKPQCVAPVSSLDLDLPLPGPLTGPLVSLGVDETYARRISSIVVKSTVSFRNYCISSFRQRQRAILSRPLAFLDPEAVPSLSRHYATLYAKLTGEWSTYITKHFAPRFVQAYTLYKKSRTSPNSSSRAKRPFNQNAIPLLEQVFTDNAFPSRLEKYDLATKCSMDYRQIHVWFQNRRSRCRKEGRSLNKPKPVNQFVDTFENAVIEKLLPEPHSEVDLDDGLAADADPSTRGVASLGLPFEGPAHAFPSPYPPSCLYDPFPVTEETRALRCPWLRQPASQIHITASDVDISRLTELMANLTIKDDDLDAQGSSSPMSSRRHRPCPSRPFLGFVTPCPRAPIPALLCPSGRPGRRLRSSACSSAPFTRVAPVAPPPVPVVAPSTAASLTSQSRSKRALPRRIPNNPPRPQIKTSGPAPRRPIPTLSRMSSASSLSSNASDSDSPLITPPSLSISLPAVSSGTVFFEHSPELIAEPQSIVKGLSLWDSSELLSAYEDHDIYTC